MRQRFSLDNDVISGSSMMKKLFYEMNWIILNEAIFAILLLVITSTSKVEQSDQPSYVVNIIVSFLFVVDWP